ncbi:unnamed protein product [Heligmosomoides polygyrus]|uniref:RAD51_interact domain-containing protein n=1 Tax=Heligmosomoides polygyrus TaxID=6339 RepID=A0A183GSR2_HELPZ|nr:unnamed protein product [Heligmosomoides polygyrus]
MATLILRSRKSSRQDSFNEESSFDEFNGDCESSQHTDVVGIQSDDDCAGSRPLLEDDALDDDDDELFSGVPSSQQVQPISKTSKSLFIDLPPISIRKSTNPFLVSASDETPKISPVVPDPVDPSNWNDCEKSVVRRCYEDILVQKSVVPYQGAPFEFAPATLPRQSTPLSAAPRFTPKPIVLANPPSVALGPFPPPLTTAVRPPMVLQQCPITQPSTASQTVQRRSDASNQVFVAQLPSRPAQPAYETEDGVSHPPSAAKGAAQSFVEGPKTPKPKKSKEKEKKRCDVVAYSGSEVETDGSEAEMCTSTSSDKASVSKKKKKPFPLLGSNPSVLPLDLKKPNSSPAVMLKKSSAKKAAAATSSSRKASAGPLNASFVNSSFLSEDLDSPPAQQSLRL